MHLAELELEEFRSYRRLDLQLDPAGLRLVGNNASGKSTLLEAVAMLATTRSPRTASERELINWESGQAFGVPPFARVRGLVERADRRADIELGLQIEPSRPSHTKKLIRLNGRSVRALDAVGTLNAVLFAPEDIDLVSGSPASRRRYLDVTISQMDAPYLRALSRYGRVLEQRNSLLKLLAGSGTDARSRSAAEQLDFWDAELIAHGSGIIARRQIVLERLRVLVAERFEQLAGRDDLELSHEMTVPLPEEQRTNAADFPALHAVVARNYEAALRAARTDEFRRGATLLGAHRDDFAFRLGGVELGLYGSRGQQRLVVLALKLAVTTLMTEIAGEPPVLMLDDVLSELDASHRSLVLSTAASMHAQTIVTATDADLLCQPDLEHLPAARVAKGNLEPVKL